MTNYLGEKLPSVDRSMHFKLTVRDILNNWGITTTSDEMTVLVANTGTPFSVTEPNASSDYWQINSTVNIKWNVGGSDQTPISTPGVNIYLSIDDGITYPYLLAENVPNNGSASVTVPADAITLAARVKVKGAGNIFFDISNEGFEINQWPASVTAISWAKDVNVFPVPATDKLHIEIRNNKTYSAVVLNALGQQVYAGEMSSNKVINTAAMPVGVYSLQLIEKGSGERLVKQFAKQ